MTKRVWNSGPPPHVGWWEASLANTRGIWRWWDGKNWSLGCTPSNSASDVSDLASSPTWCWPDQIKWTHYWPENARVPRINPETGEKTGG